MPVTVHSLEVNIITLSSMYQCCHYSVHDIVLDLKPYILGCEIHP